MDPVYEFSSTQKLPFVVPTVFNYSVAPGYDSINTRGDVGDVASRADKAQARYKERDKQGAAPKVNPTTAYKGLDRLLGSSNIRSKYAGKSPQYKPSHRPTDAAYKTDVGPKYALQYLQHNVQPGMQQAQMTASQARSLDSIADVRMYMQHMNPQMSYANTCTGCK